MKNDMLTQAIANLEAVAAEMRAPQWEPLCAAIAECWADKVLTAVSDLREVEAVVDTRPCTGCGASLSECYDKPTYKGRLNCCHDCDHFTREQLRRIEEQRVRRSEALSKLTPEEISALGLKPDADEDGGQS